MADLYIYIYTVDGKPLLLFLLIVRRAAFRRDHRPIVPLVAKISSCIKGDEETDKVDKSKASRSDSNDQRNLLLGDKVGEEDASEKESYCQTS